MNIFVYGTLMTGFKNNYLLSNCQLLGFGETKEKFGLYSSKCGNFPFVIESIKNETIKEIGRASCRERVSSPV